MSINVETVVTGPFQENSYIVWYSDSTDAIIVDPGDDKHLIIQSIDDHKLTPMAIVNTHAHLDHIGAVQPLKHKYDIPFYLHPNEQYILNTYEDACKMFGIPPRETPAVDVWFNDAENLKINAFNIHLVPTPGHTPGGTCLEIDNHLFVGDTLFRGSVGRTDLPGGDWATLESSLVHLFNSVAHDRIVHPGHGPDTTLHYELKENPFLIPLKDRVN